MSDKYNRLKYKYWISNLNLSNIDITTYTNLLEYIDDIKISEKYNNIDSLNFHQLNAHYMMVISINYLFDKYITEGIRIYYLEKINELEINIDEKEMLKDQLFQDINDSIYHVIKEYDLFNDKSVINGILLYEISKKLEQDFYDDYKDFELINIISKCSSHFLSFLTKNVNRSYDEIYLMMKNFNTIDIDDIYKYIEKNYKYNEVIKSINYKLDLFYEDRFENINTTYKNSNFVDVI